MWYFHNCLVFHIGKSYEKVQKILLFLLFKLVPFLWLKSVPSFNWVLAQMWYKGVCVSWQVAGARPYEEIFFHSQSKSKTAIYFSEIISLRCNSLSPFSQKFIVKTNLCHEYFSSSVKGQFSLVNILYFKLWLTRYFKGISSGYNNGLVVVSIKSKYHCISFRISHFNFIAVS